MEEKVETYFCDFRVEEAVLKKTRKAQNEMGEMKLPPKRKIQGFYSTKYLMGKVNRKVTAWEEKSVMSKADKRLFSILVLELLGLKLLYFIFL